MFCRIPGTIGLAVMALFAAALLGVPHSAHAELKPQRIPVDGVAREALVHLPAGQEPVPLVFVFHGHGGNAVKAAEQYGFQNFWPEAATIYMQGLPTPIPTDPEGKKSGWQMTRRGQGDRDLKCFDAALKRMKSLRAIDTRRVYAIGFSNGGFFSYVLWSARRDQLAAIAMGGCIYHPKAGELQPLPCLHLAGKDDDLIPLARQQESMERIRQVNGCDAVGKRWVEHPKIVSTYFKSAKQAPFVSVICPVGHEVPKVTGFAATKFFKEHSRPEVKKPGA